MICYDLTVNQPNSLKKKTHYSSGYAQQVNYPHNAMQVGPIYFRTPWKCNVIGICLEASVNQIKTYHESTHRDILLQMSLRDFCQTCPTSCLTLRSLSNYLLFKCRSTSCLRALKVTLYLPVAIKWNIIQKRYFFKLFFLFF